MVVESSTLSTQRWSSWTRVGYITLLLRDVDCGLEQWHGSVVVGSSILSGVHPAKERRSSSHCNVTVSFSSRSRPAPDKASTAALALALLWEKWIVVDCLVNVNVPLWCCLDRLSQSWCHYVTSNIQSINKCCISAPFPTRNQNLCKIVIELMKHSHTELMSAIFKMTAAVATADFHSTHILFALIN